MIEEKKRCQQCNVSLEMLGTREFRTGGTTGGWKLLFGEWAELREDMIELEIWACPKCRRVELYLPGTGD
ncbi:MAG TPA: hypothetical protein GXX19_06350 [Syntrophomonadaceae bacterium]|nr:hypothetical protein [Syntrophomonadaceae bacterium]